MNFYLLYKTICLLEGAKVCVLDLTGGQDVHEMFVKRRAMASKLLVSKTKFRIKSVNKLCVCNL